MNQIAGGRKAAGALVYDAAGMLMFLKNLAFTLIVPGTVAAYLPLYIAREQTIGPVGALAGC